MTLHTTGDEVVPFWHEILYLGKAWSSARSSFIPIPTLTYGHCNFTAVDVLVAFAVLVDQVQGASRGRPSTEPTSSGMGEVELVGLEPAARMLPQRAVP